MPSTGRARASIFLLSFSVLFLEVILTRLFVGLIFDRLNYLPLSMAMLGLSAAGITVFHRPERQIARDAARALTASLLFLVLFFATLCASNWVIVRADPSAAPGLFLKTRFLLIVAYGTISVIPFYCMGVLIAALFRAF